MVEVLNIFEGFYFDICSVVFQIVVGQVDQYDVFGIFFGVIV